MTTDRELMQQALDALNRSDYLGWQLQIPIIKALRARLAEPEPEVRWDASAPLVVHPHPAFQATQPQPDLAAVGEVGVWGKQDKENNDDKS